MKIRQNVSDAVVVLVVMIADDGDVVMVLMVVMIVDDGDVIDLVLIVIVSIISFRYYRIFY